MTDNLDGSGTLYDFKTMTDDELRARAEKVKLKAISKVKRDSDGTTPYTGPDRRANRGDDAAFVERRKADNAVYNGPERRRRPFGRRGIDQQK